MLRFGHHRDSCQPSEWPTIRDLFRHANADDGGLVRDEVPAEWREEAGSWQMWFAPVDRATLIAVAREARIIRRSMDEDATMNQAIICAWADRHVADWWREQAERTEAAFAARSALAHAVAQLAAAVENAVGVEVRGQLFGSYYGHKHGVKIRVSDHFQVAGGGWNDGRQERMGEAEVEFVITAADAPIPSRGEIRRQIAQAVRNAR